MANGLNSQQVVRVGQPMETSEGSAMRVEGVETALRSISRFFKVADTVSATPTLADAKSACEKSRDAWLSLFPVRRVLMNQYRDVVGDFIQSLDQATDSVTELLHRDGPSMEATDAADLKHYAENMKGRVRLLTSLLVGEERVTRNLVERTSSLSERK